MKREARLLLDSFKCGWRFGNFSYRNSLSV